METSLDAKWDEHSRGLREGHVPRLALDIHLGHVPVWFGQEHLMCVTTIYEQVMQCVETQQQPKVSFKYQLTGYVSSVVRASASQSGDRGSNPGRVILPSCLVLDIMGVK